MRSIDETHDPGLTSWVDSARSHPEFPIQNLPFCVFRPPEEATPRGGVGIGDEIVDLAALSRTGLVTGTAADVLAAATGPTLNPLMALGPEASTVLRAALSDLLQEGADAAGSLRDCLVSQRDAHFELPALIRDYTDFYSSIHHATNIGRLFRPDDPLLPNYKWLPVGYHGRSSSIVLSGTDFHRPVGQIKPPDAGEPVVAPCERLDYELEVGLYLGQGNGLGHRIDIDHAEDHAFGLCLLNDWSARDIQAWEYQPLGPFLAKSFATTVSPWIVTMEALAPFRCEWWRPADDPQPLEYLDSPSTRSAGAVELTLEVLLETPRMREARQDPVRLSLSNFTDSYWTLAQMIAHHTVAGCNLNPGDLFGSGTMSGASDGSQAALIEITRGGSEPLALPNGETRAFLDDGDRVILRGWCEREGAARIGFGEASGTVLPAAVTR